MFDDEQGCSGVMGWDRDCEGALCWTSGTEPVVVFPNGTEAAKAIRISEKYAALREAQGKPENIDFTPEYRRCIKIVPCGMVGESKKS